MGDSDYEYEEDIGDDDEEYQYESDDDGDKDYTQPETSSITVESNVFNIVMDPNKPTSEEWRNIYAMLRNVITRSSRKIIFDWDNEHESSFRYVVLSFQSYKDRSAYYPFRISFPFTNELYFPEVPPVIQALFPLPPQFFVNIFKHPLLSARNWNPCQDLLIIFEHIVSVLDMNLSNVDSWINGLPVAGGNLYAHVADGKELNSWIKEPKPSLALEHIISVIYGYYVFELSYGADLLDMLLHGVQNVLSACPLNLRKELPKNSGIGYSRETRSSSQSNSTEEKMSLLQAVMSILQEKLSSIIAVLSRPITKDTAESDPVLAEFNNLFNIPAESKQFKKISVWLRDCPLFEVLVRNINSMASGDLIRDPDYLIDQFDLVLSLEQLYELAGIEIKDTEKEGFEMVYNKLYTWSKLDLLNSELSERLGSWYENFTRKSKLMIQIQLNQSILSSINPLCSSSSQQPSSKLQRTERNLVFYVANLENHHFHYTGSVGSSNYKGVREAIPVQKCNKFFLRELKTLNESLPDEVMVFASEEHPNYLMAAMKVINPDCPYYGGVYLFHIMVPANYPEVPPKVQYMTTGYGTVRFNPNLYNCGKVCLSLLGTWQGEPWNPKSSSLTQVLSSILFLIFTEEPYYNEPGFDSGGRIRNTESLRYDGNIIGQALTYAILDHFVKPSPIAALYEQICQYYKENWINEIYPKLLNNLQRHRDGRTLPKPWEKVEEEIDQIHAFVKKL